ncbi:hypothetical protein BH23ACT11_BH23ACT11_25800 [soil metagenome]
MGMTIRILRAVFTVSAPLFALFVALSWIAYDSLVQLLGPEYFIRIASLLIGAEFISSGLLMWNEWRQNPIDETERGEWTGSQLLYSLVFAITLFVSAYYLPALVFSF